MVCIRLFLVVRNEKVFYKKKENNIWIIKYVNKYMRVVLIGYVGKFLGGGGL